MRGHCRNEIQMRKLPSMDYKSREKPSFRPFAVVCTNEQPHGGILFDLWLNLSFSRLSLRWAGSRRLSP
jgi:hypothetical protein